MAFRQGTFCPAHTELRGRRFFGSLQGKIRIAEDFDTMLRDEIEEMFYGKR